MRHPCQWPFRKPLDPVRSNTLNSRNPAPIHKMRKAPFWAHAERRVRRCRSHWRVRRSKTCGRNLCLRPQEDLVPDLKKVILWLKMEGDWLPAIWTRALPPPFPKWGGERRALPLRREGGGKILVRKAWRLSYLSPGKLSRIPDNFRGDNFLGGGQCKCQKKRIPKR